MRAVLLTAAVGLAIVAGGCAASSRVADLGPVRFAAAERGRSIVQARCASCHAIGASTQSPRAAAPPFQVLKDRYVEVTLQRKMTEIAETGHYDMPPLQLHADEVEAIVAYFDSLADR